MSELDAIRVAMLSYTQPLRRPERSRANLPDGVILVIKCAAGDVATIERLSQELGASAKTLQEAASIYLQKHLTGGKAIPFQQLGLTDQASPDDIVLHKRWLLKWLHPDRNPNKWQSAMFNSVTDAAAAASAVVSSQEASTKPALPPASSGLNKSSRSHHASGSHRISAHVQKRKRVRIINWRALLMRVARRAVLVGLLLPLVYLGATKFFDGQTKWALSAYDFWPK